MLNNYLLFISILLCTLFHMNYAIDNHPDETCRGPNEEYLFCGTACQRTCFDYEYEISCDKSCVKGCFCKPGYIRNAKFRCVLPEKCYDDDSSGPDCNVPNEVYMECGSTCPDTCDNYMIVRKCNRQCIPGCFCRAGYVRDSLGFCIMPKFCPPPGLIVPTMPTCKKPNEVYKICGTMCPETCDNYGEEITCKKKCVTGCFCEKGYVRDRNKNCILPEDCPYIETYEEPICEGYLEEYLICGSACQKTCDNYNTTKLCDFKCVEGCFCKLGLVRNEYDDCIFPDECPPAKEAHCRYLEEPASKKRPCSGTCEEPNKCRPGPPNTCVCMAGTVRDELDQCIFIDRCPLGCSGLNEVFDCASPCDTKCRNLGKPCRRHTFRCIPKCYCKEGFARDHRKRCVPIKYCPIKTPLINIFIPQINFVI